MPKAAAAQPFSPDNPPAITTILQAAKSADDSNQHALALIRHDPDAEKLLVAWSYMRLGPCDRLLKKDEDYVDGLQELWRGLEETIDYGKLSDSSGVSYKRTLELFPRLQMARLVFPDGSVSANALRAVCLRMLENNKPGGQWR